MEKELSIEELINALRCCANEGTCDKCPLIEKAADALAKLNDFRNSQLAKALAENTRLTKELDVERHR